MRPDGPEGRRTLPASATLVVLALAAGLAVGGCAPEAAHPELPLVDPVHTPDVLTEARPLTPPPATDGNRFLAGWQPGRRGGEPTLTARETGGRLELVHLDRRERRLSIDLVDLVDLVDLEEPGGAVRVRAAGRDLGTQPLTDPLVLRLPADLPRGRVTVEVVPLEGTAVVARAAEVRPVLPAGAAAFEGADVLQTGHSSIDFVRPLAGGETLVGSFRPPASPRPGQEFLLQLERDGHRRTVFHWRPTLWNRLRGRRRLAVPLGAERGFVRVRLEARGTGPAGRWDRLAIARAAAPEAAVAGPATGPGARGGPRDPPRAVVVYVMDALRADHVGHLGGAPGSSPTVDRLASEGRTFRNHRSIAPNTQPSTKALFTGEAHVERGGGRLPADGPATLAEVFRAAGYRTALFSNNPYVSARYGMDRGFDHVGEEPGSQAGFHDDAARIHAAALGWLATLDPAEPVFLYLHTLHPHNPYDPPPDLRERFTGELASPIDGSTRTLVDIQHRRRRTTAADRQRLRGLYTGGLAYNDRELAPFLAAVREIYGERETFLALTSDHGEELFDHGGVLHGYTLYEEMIRIPLVLWAPGRVRPGSSTASTGTLDLHATLVRLAGAGTGAPSEGRSLLPGAPEAAGPEIHLAAAASVRGGLYSAQSRRWKVVLAPRTGSGWGMGVGAGRSRDPEYLFDLGNDPGERVNRAGEGDLEAAWLRSRLLGWVRSRQAVAAPPADEPEVDEETRRRLRALGYLD